MRHLLGIAAAALVATSLSSAIAQDENGEIRNLSVDVAAQDMPTKGFVGFACGSNGGPPLRPIGGWTDYASCPPEPNGLHEVYVEYDDQGLHVAELYREMYGQALWLEKYAGTKVAGHPVILSVLFDANGVSRGIRAVTDSRAPLDLRVRGHALRLRIKPRYHDADWDCADLPLAAGETPIGSRFVKERCETVLDDGRRMVLFSQMLRKPGQTGFDDQGRRLEGDFESSTRWEIWSSNAPNE